MLTRLVPPVQGIDDHMKAGMPLFAQSSNYRRMRWTVLSLAKSSVWVTRTTSNRYQSSFLAHPRIILGAYSILLYEGLRQACE